MKRLISLCTWAVLSLAIQARQTTVYVSLEDRPCAVLYADITTPSFQCENQMSASSCLSFPCSDTAASTAIFDDCALSLDFVEACTSIRMVISLPNGSSLKDVSLNGKPSHQMRCQSLKEDGNTHGNQYKAVVWFIDGSEFANTDNFLSLLVSGNKGISISDIRLTNKEYETIFLPNTGSATKIGDLAAQPSCSPTEHSLYNLQGQEVAKPHKGVFILGNRKVIVK